MAAFSLAALRNECPDERSPLTGLTVKNHSLPSPRAGAGRDYFYTDASRKRLTTNSRGRLAKNHPAFGPLSLLRKS